AEVREKAAEVFARTEFRSAGLSWMRDFFAWLGSLHEVAPALFWLLLIGCVLLLIALVTHIALQLRWAFTAGRDGRAGADAHEERVRRSAAYRLEAGRRAEAGDYTEAVRFLFLSLVYRFDERGRVSFRKAYTNREYLDLVGGRADVRAALGVMVDVLDDHWYGQTPCGRPRYDDCLAVYDRLAA
ncbi:MAG TPA: DUF4129 domain-containing protein, partial [Urbifossiella sp.]|nr:DUF4129 domain-containing protein [Urbifossiella sp.]